MYYVSRYTSIFVAYIYYRDYMYIKFQINMLCSQDFFEVCGCSTIRIKAYDFNSLQPNIVLFIVYNQRLLKVNN